QYTCFTVSRNFLIFGATSGGLYVFKREPCIFLHLLPNKEGSITQVSVSPDEKYFAFATVKGVVCILEQSQSLKFRRVQTSAEHHGSEVTALQWNACRSELFVGDDSGRISVISSSAFVGKNMFQTPSFILMRLDSRIIQLDWCSELLLISTLSRCYVCDTVKERYRQIGHKLREGEYGACFYVTGDRRDLPSRYEHRGSKTGGAFSSLSADEKFACCEGLQNLKMFCARPGSRLWKVKTDGTVLSTHHFKQALAIPPTNITGPHDMQRVGGSVLEATQNEECGRQSFNFTKLFIIAKKFIFTFKRDGIYILDPDKGSVILWNNSFKDIVDAKTLDDAVYIWTASGRMHALLMLPLDRVLVRLYLRKEYALCAHLCGLHHKYLMELATASSKLQILADLGTKLKDSEVARTIHPLLQEIRKFAREKQNVQRLRSGIFLVENKQFFCSKEGENGESLKSHLCVRSTKEKSRSLSASPESSRRKKNGASRREMKSVSVTSLPELAFRSNGLSTEDGTQPYHRLRAKHDSSGDALVSKSGDSLSSSDSAFHPEGVQVLKELKYSVSWKSLKEKWKMLEESAKSHCYSLFLSYLEKMPASSDCLSKVFSDDHLRLYATVAFEEVNSVANGSCVCGFPVICSKTMLYPDLAKVLVSYYWDSNQGRLIELCKKVPSLWHLILPRKEDGGFSSVLPLIIHLGDTLELEKWLPNMDHAAWSRTLDLLAVFRSGTCVNCGSVFATSKDQLGGMLWSSVGPLMVKALGPHEAVQLMTKYASHIAPGELGVRFFQSCIYSAIIDNHARGLRNEVIAMLNACSKEAAKTALFSPVVCPSVEEALKEDLGKHVQLPIASEKYHWGVKVNMVDGNCPFCSLPLGSLVLMKDGGVMTFRCGHSYHVVCLERQTQR
ncbi:hypothetical protein L798_00714, partial [Zootermopsis nevadensis]